MPHQTEIKTNGCNHAAESPPSCPIQLFNYRDKKALLIDTLHAKAMKDGFHCTDNACRGSIMFPAFGKNVKNPEQVLAEAEDFIAQYYNTNDKSNNAITRSARLREIRECIKKTGTYKHTTSELIFGAKTAWRNAPRCIGRIQWSKLQIFDAREATTTRAVFEAICEHVQYATNNGNIRSAITIFSSSRSSPGVRIWNSQFIRYAGYEREDGSVIGDPASVELTKICLKLGWKMADQRTRFDVLPIVLSVGDNDPELFEYPPELIKQVPLVHPRYPKFNRLHLRWYAVPAVSSMALDCGGIYYQACGFNGWYQSTEIVRNLCDAQRYNLLKEIAISFELDILQPAVFWKDATVVEINSAVMYSYQAERVTIVDQYSASESFMTHLANEHRLRGGCPSDWVWIVPPIGAQATGVFHQEMLNYKLLPSYEYQMEPWIEHKWKIGDEKQSRTRKLTLCSIFRAVWACTILMMKAVAARKKCTILYASETGKSERFARTLSSIFECVFNVKLYRMDQYDYEALHCEQLLLIVTSTFGTGQPPDNGEGFYEYLQTLKCNTLENGHISQRKYQAVDLEALPQTGYAVFGLGSTAYPNFCAFAQEVDSLLEKIGFQRLLTLTKGDELSGQDEAFHRWCKLVLEVAQRSCNIKASTYLTQRLSECNAEVEWNSETYRIVMPDEQTVTNYLQGLNKIHKTKVLEFTALKVENLKQSGDRMIQVSLKNSPGIEYYPGDHLAVFPENDSHQVETIIEHVIFGEVSGVVTADTIVSLQVIRGTEWGTADWVALGRVPDCSLRTALKYYFDISSPPSRHLLGTCVAYAENSFEMQTLTNLSQDERKYQQWITDNCPSTVDLLNEFPSLLLPATLLLTLLPILQPRYYSISNSPAMYQQEVHLTVGVVQYTAGRKRTDASTVKTKFGLCSKYLATLQPGDIVLGFVRLKASFHMPSTLESPLIMVCQGSGIAPFRGFWQQRELNRQLSWRNSQTNFGEAHLYFGCRSESDVVYRQELNQCVNNGSLSTFSLALSRQARQPKTYVQDLMKHHACRVHDVLYVRKGHIYVCGNVKMAQQVKETVSYILQEVEQLSSDDANDYLRKMKGENRFHEDIFGAVRRSNDDFADSMGIY